MKLDQIVSQDTVLHDLKGTTHEEVVRELSQRLYQNKKIDNMEGFVEDVLKREAEISTILENGIAIPHARTAHAKELNVAVGISQAGIDCQAADGEKTQIFFLIATPETSNDAHIKALSVITGKMLDASFRKQMLLASNENELYQLLIKEEEEVMSTKNERFFLGVTGCPVGVAHTYLAAKALDKAAGEKGVAMKVETNGSIGVENELTADDIKKAEAIIVACDKQVDLDRFAGKKVIFATTKGAIDGAEKLLDQAMSGDVPLYKGDGAKSSDDSPAGRSQKGLYAYLMNGVSYMIPFVVVGGILIALALAVGGEPTPGGMVIPEGSFWNQILDVGVAGFTLMVPILAGYIAYAIGDRPALAPGMIGGWIANDGSFYNAESGTGFLGALVAGLLVGYFIKYMKKINWPKVIGPLVPIMILPITGSLFIAFIFIFIIGAPIAGLMESLEVLLADLSMGGFIGIGLVIGLMQGFDMGGPFGKVAFMFSVGLIASGETQFMGAQAAAIPVAPLGMAIATFVDKKVFNSEERANGKAALAMGLVGISEGAIPFAASDPVAVLPANMIGSAVACILGFAFGLRNTVAHGGPIVALLGALNYPLLALLAMLIGSLVTAFIAIAIKRIMLRKRTKSSAAA